MLISKIVNKLYQYWLSIGIGPMLSLLFGKWPRAVLFGVPLHANVGDLAQFSCIREWISTNYPSYSLVCFSWRSSHGFALNLLRRTLRDNDLIFFHSGYLLTGHHREFPVFCRVTEMFQSAAIVVFPQTILLEHEHERQRLIRSFGDHRSMTLLCRDEVSFASARKLLGETRLLLYPDVVTSLIGTREYSSERSGVILCVRNDKEKHYTDEEIQLLASRFEDSVVEIMDTSIRVRSYKLQSQFDEIFASMLSRFSRAKVVITDRYHGTIFSLIASTPVVVLASADHKLESGVKWFPDAFSDYVHYAHDLEEAYRVANAKINAPHPGVLKDTYFNREYYSKLKGVLNSEED